MYSFHIHNFFHLIKSLLGLIYHFDSFNPKNQFIVLNYHGTQKKYMNNFIKQIEFYKKKYHILTPSEFEDVIDNKKYLEGKNLIITFDDGIKNNLYAIEYLNSQNIKAYFFIVPEFIDAPPENQKDYFIKNIRPIININIDSEEEDFEALSWEDLKEISKIHTIGSHTYSHTMTKNVLSKEHLKKELIDSKFCIENNLNCDINSFCSINNTFLTIGANELKLISENYKYHFSTFGGPNKNLHPYLIERINVEAYWMMGAVKFALSKLEFNRWKNKVKLYRELIKKSISLADDGFNH